MHRHTHTLLVVAIVSASIAGVSSAADLEAGPLEQRVQQIRAQIRAEPETPEKLFHPDFLSVVPAAQVHAILKQYFGMAGKVVRVTKTSSEGEFFGAYRFTTEKGSSFPVKIGVAHKAPHLINTLWFGLPEADAESFGEVLKKLEALDGTISFAFCRLGGDKPEILEAINPDKRLAIGSTFKLYILGALVSAVNEGSLTWDQVARIEASRKSLPSGVLQDWPDGAPVTLHTLATQMISISDNTATDHLLHAIGREKVEASVKRMGHGKPQLNVPFLSTLEMFRIKEIGHSDERIAAYVAGDAKARREYLDQVLSKLDRESFGGFNQVTPTAVDEVEWFASASDLCRAMDWLRVSTEGEGSPARGVLGVNRGMEFADTEWSYVGYKGGSEPGVLNLTWLLQHKNGAWFALSAGWNDTKKKVDELELVSLMQRFADLAASPPAEKAGAE